ncbi:hypothetical protein AB0D57_40420 [Streptomyces sp. NPDC048275]|uniref:hypothetical protein n=1 Tax=Streptomyces sp. NPDC048275 TaxID=3155629 RepID=UPI0033DA974A
MPRGRHRHSPPLHRLLPPSAIAGVSLVCAVGPWLFTEPLVLRTLAAGAAVTAVAGGFVMRRWDTAAGKRVADLTRARASDEWRHEERVAELETDLDESRELRTKLEHKLRAKRAELAGLRNEHAALLRRYATAETERATALEGRRLLAIETTAPARALPAASTAAAESVEPAATPETPENVAAASEDPSEEAAVETEGAEAEATEAEATEAEATEMEATEAEATEAEAADESDDESTDAPASPATPASPEVFSPTGSSLFLRANAALSRIASGAAGAEAEVEAETASDSDPDPDPEPESRSVPENDDASEAVQGELTKGETSTDGSAYSGSVTGESANGEPAQGVSPETGPSADAAAEEDEAQGKPEAVDEHERSAAVPASVSAQPAGASPSVVPVTPVKPVKPVKSAKPSRPSGHFAVPTAVAVAPAAPVRRPSVEGGFDFFGTQKETSSDALDSVQNEDLADVVGQEALALHKADAEFGFKPADEEYRGVGQVIDLTAHDETEQIDLVELRSAAS